MRDLQGSPNRRYLLQHEIGRGGMGVVYTAYDRLGGQFVALKRLKTQLEAANERDTELSPTVSIAMHAGPVSLFAADRVARTLHSGLPERWTTARTGDDRAHISRRHALIEEFRILATLRHPYVISVFDYGLDAAGDPFYTMELLERAQTLRRATTDTPPSVRLSLLVQIAQALTYLHRRGVVHGDLKPGNVLVTSQGDGLRCKVLDFGLAVAVQQPLTGFVRAGTLAYMAPEVLDGAEPSMASDLFALGVIAYELLSGGHPFDTTTERRLRASIRTQEPDLDRLAQTPVLRELISQLLAKDPAARQRDVTAVEQELARAAGVELVAEDSAVRDSFLQAATLVGREREMKVLQDAIEQLSAGRGGSILIGGESGVGKSRLLEEARVAALTRGALVLRGQAADAGAGAHQILREPLRHAILYMEPPPSDFEAGVLLPLVTDLPQLLQRELTAVPELDAKATQERLFELIESTLLRLEQPVLLLLDDLQWVSVDTLSLLLRIVRRTASAPILVIAGFRDDESPRLAELLEGSRYIKIGRLAPAQIERLSEAMLGPRARSPELLDLLQQESAGNAFFIVEVVRALAARAGGLSAVGQRELPSQVGSGGVLAVLESRLNRTSPALRPLLELAAVMGRQIDPAALATLIPAAQLELWLHALTEQAILEPVESQWRFCHDKLRERLLDSLSPEQLQALHAQAAHAIEEAYGDLVSHASALARHYVGAKQAKQAAYYLDRAGEAALLQGATVQAERLLSDALYWQGRSAPSELPLLARVRTRRLHAAALAGLGRLSECITEIDRALEMCGFPCRQVDAAFVLSMSSQLVAQTLRWFGRSPLAGPALSKEVANELLLCFELAGAPLAMISDARRMVYMSLLGVNLAERFQIREDAATCSAILSYALFSAGRLDLSARYLQRADAERAAVSSPRVDESVYKVHGCLAQYTGRWEEAEDYLQRAIEVCRRIGDTTREQLDVLVLMSNRYFIAQYDAALADVQVLQRLADQSQNMQFQGWCALARAAVALQRGQFAEAHRMMDGALPIVAASQDVVAETSSIGLRALSALRVGRNAEARLCAEHAVARMEARPLMGHGMMEGAVAPAEVSLILWSVEKGAAERRELFGLFTRALKQVRRYMVSFWFARPRLLLWEAAAAWAHGTRGIERGLLALREAERLRMPLEIGLSHKLLSEMTGGRTAANHQAHARELFLKLGVEWRAGVPFLCLPNAP